MARRRERTFPGNVEEINRLRLTKGWSIDTLAKKSCSKRTFDKVMRGERVLLSSLQSIADALGVKLESILHDSLVQRKPIKITVTGSLAEYADKAKVDFFCNTVTSMGMLVGLPVVVVLEGGSVIFTLSMLSIDVEFFLESLDQFVVPLSMLGVSFPNEPEFVDALAIGLSDWLQRPSGPVIDRLLLSSISILAANQLGRVTTQSSRFDSPRFAADVILEPSTVVVRLGNSAYLDSLLSLEKNRTEARNQVKVSRQAQVQLREDFRQEMAKLTSEMEQSMKDSVERAMSEIDFKALEIAIFGPLTGSLKD